MRRARSDDDKLERRGQILDAALRMYEANPSFAVFTMAALGAETGLAKGTLYLYFRTKEALFLALLDRMLGEWFADVERRAARGTGAWTADEAAEALLDSVRGRPTLLRLLAIMATILEHNVAFETALEFKRMLHERAGSVGARLEARLPWLAAGEGGRMLVYLHALVVGLWQQAEPSPVVARILGEPEMAAIRVDFERDLGILLRALLTGMRARAEAAAAG
jgi:AcrR family transcriptional regulator